MALKLQASGVLGEITITIGLESDRPRALEDPVASDCGNWARRPRAMLSGGLRLSRRLVALTGRGLRFPNGGVAVRLLPTNKPSGANHSMEP